MQSNKSNERKVFQIRKKARYAGFNVCPSKNSTYALQNDDHFSIGGVTKTFRIDAIIRFMEKAHTFRSSQGNDYGFAEDRERVPRKV